jgi:hypothetical protein
MLSIFTDMKKTLFTLSILFCAHSLCAQEGSVGYEFLEIPVSAHSAALGGNNVSVIEDDITLIYTNPALLSNISSTTLNFNYLSYISNTNKLSATFGCISGERGAWAIGAQVLSYGSMKETTEDFVDTGEFSANDMAIQGGYSYLFNDKLSGGVVGKALMSNYGNYSSLALAVDIGINYYDADRGFSVGIVAQNIGREVDHLHEESVDLPFDLSLGFSKDLNNAPIRLSFTLSDLTNWGNYYEINGKSQNFSKRFFNHLTIGADVFPSASTWLALGYNFRRANEMEFLDDSHWAGFSFGGGLSIRKFKIGVAYGKYHVGASSIVVNATYNL